MSERSTVKTPPSFGDIDGKDYTTWKNEVELWRRITDVELKKQAPAIVLALAGKAREIGLQMDVTELNVDMALTSFFKSWMRVSKEKKLTAHMKRTVDSRSLRRLWTLQ